MCSFDLKFPMPLCLPLPTTTKKKIKQNKMNNPGFIDEDNIPLPHADPDDDYDDYKTSNTSRIDETSFTEHDTTEATSNLRLRQKVKQDKITAFYRHLNVTGNLDLIDLDRVRLTTNPKTGNTDLLS